MLKRVLVLAVVAVFLAGCGAGHRVRDAVLRDTLFSVEETENGYYRIWLTHDDICGYCTNDSKLGKEAMDILKEHSGEVLVYFRDMKAGDPEWSWWDKSDCGTIWSGDSSAKMFMFYELSRVSPR